MSGAAFLGVWLGAAIVSGVLIGAFIRAGSTEREKPARGGCSSEKARKSST